MVKGANELFLQDLESKRTVLEKKYQEEKSKPNVTITTVAAQREVKEINKEIEKYWAHLTPVDRVYIARKKNRPKIYEYIDFLFDDFFEQKGDRLYSDDKSIVGGIAFYKGMPITIVGTNKGDGLDENIECRFGMPQPDGYRKALRIMEQAEKFGRPIVTFVDTPGAYPGLEAEERGQGTAIAQCIAKMSQLSVPIITVITGEGGSGGALALSVSNYWLMLENAVYAILSPEGFASILWKDSTKSKEACDLMKLTAKDLYDQKIVDHIIEEGIGDASKNREAVFSIVDKQLEKYFSEMQSWSKEQILQHRKNKFRKIGI